MNMETEKRTPVVFQSLFQWRSLRQLEEIMHDVTDEGAMSLWCFLMAIVMRKRVNKSENSG